MVLFFVVVFALYLAHRAMTEGLISVMGRCAMGAFSIATGVGFAGPLRLQIPYESPHLFGVCFLAIVGVAYLLQRGVTSYYMLERDIVLPEYIDRFGAAMIGFLGGLMLGGFICLASLTFPLPPMADRIRPEIERSASFAVDTARIFGAVAGKGPQIALKTFLPQTHGTPETNKAS